MIVKNTKSCISSDYVIIYSLQHYSMLGKGYWQENTEMPILQRDVIIRTILFAIALLLIFPSAQIPFKDPSRKAFACQCREDPEAKPTVEALNESMAVFSGVVTDIESGGLGKIVQFDVDKAWKGISNKSVYGNNRVCRSLVWIFFRDRQGISSVLLWGRLFTRSKALQQNKAAI